MFVLENWKYICGLEIFVYPKYCNSIKIIIINCPWVTRNRCGKNLNLTETHKMKDQIHDWMFNLSRLNTAQYRKLRYKTNSFLIRASRSLLGFVVIFHRWLYILHKVVLFPVFVLSLYLSMITRKILPSCFINLALLVYVFYVSSVLIFWQLISTAFYFEEPNHLKFKFFWDLPHSRCLPLLSFILI